MIFMHKITLDIFPKYFHELTSLFTVHDYSTRKKDNFIFGHAYKKNAQNSVLFVFKV